MKIGILSKWDCSGGAPRAAYRLFRALQKYGESVDYIVHEGDIKDPHIHQVDTFYRDGGFEDEGLIQKNYVIYKRTAISNTYFSVTFNGANLELNPHIQNADIINLHWVEKFVSLKTLAYLVSTGKPIVWTLHDQRPFTGGCHYSAGCLQYKAGSCMSCAQLTKDPCSLPAAVLKSKIEILKGANLVVVTPSKWLAEEAAESEAFSGFRIEVIPNSLKTDIFTPHDKAVARRNHSIPQDAFVILSGSHYNNEKRKGFKEYVDAINSAFQDESFRSAACRQKVIIVTFGVTTHCDLDNKITHIDLGHISDDDQLAEIYSAADIYVSATLEDNLPNTVLEAMACGTPVVAFNTGGLPDMVNADNGKLVPVGDSNALASAIIEIFNHPDIARQAGESAVCYVRDNFNEKTQANRYISLFNELHPVETCEVVLDEDAIYRCALEKSRREQLYYSYLDALPLRAKRVLYRLYNYFR